jgi:hypothetical protein
MQPSAPRQNSVATQRNARLLAVKPSKINLIVYLNIIHNPLFLLAIFSLLQVNTLLVRPKQNEVPLTQA